MTKSLLHREATFEPLVRLAVGFAFILSLFLYGYFLALSITHTIASQEAVHETAALEEQLGSLEQSYATITNTLTPTNAGLYGLAMLTEINFGTPLDTTAIAR